MSEAKKGNTVSIHYTGRLPDGTVFDSSRERDPLEFTLGEGRVIPGFEKAVEGMETGQSKTAEIPSGEAYGPRKEELVMEIPRERLPEGMDPDVGDQLQMTTADGQVVPVRVADADDGSVTVDANHPLAGQDLTFDIELVEVS